MVIKLKQGISEQELGHIIERIEELGCSVETMTGTSRRVLGVLGDTAKIDEKKIIVLEGIDSVQRITVPYKLVSREYQKENSVIKVGNIEIGSNKLVIMGGPCSVESFVQLDTTAAYVAKAGAQILRGGIVKPRTSPYAFQGMGEEGLQLMEAARAKYGTPIVCELMSVEQVKEFGSRLDMIQIGARNMQNFDLLKEVGNLQVPILLKRGMSATIEEWLMSAEYIMANGNKNVVLCERGIRTFESAYRNVTDLNAVPMIKKLTHLPIIVDPSHATGIVWMVEDLAKAAVAVGADGIMLETHFNPEIALSDGPQSLNEEQYNKVMDKIIKLDEFLKSM